MASDASWTKCDRVYTSEKAGMAAVDKERVKKTIYDMSKDSEHFKNEQRKQQQLEQRIDRLRSVAETLTPEKLAELTTEADAKLQALEATRDLSQIWFHVDMDAFFAAVEERHNPALKGRPIAVGGKAMISTANYEARKYGVRSAMPGFIALKLCPELILVPNDFAKYRAASEQTRHIFRRFDPDFEAGSLDEAYLNVTAYLERHGVAAVEAAAALREAVLAETQLTCSVGIAPNTLLAKVASDMNKPNGQYEILSDAEQIQGFLQTLPVRKISGIGRVSEETLAAFGVEHCGDLISKRGLVAALFSPSNSDFFLHVGVGIGRTQHHEPIAPGEIGRKGMSCERTFHPLSLKSELLKKLEDIAEDLARHLAAERLRGKTLTLKLKSQTFEVRTRAVTLGFYIGTAKELMTQATPLLEAEMSHAPFRLMGIRLSMFETRGPTRQSMLTDFYTASETPSPNHCPHAPTDAAEGDWRCEECGMVCCTESCLQEHRDFHFASELQRQENTLPSTSVPKPSASTKPRRIQKARKRRSSVKYLTLDALLSREQH